MKNFFKGNYRFKTIITGKSIEFYEYESLVTVGVKKNQIKRKSDSKEKSEENAKKRLNRARTKIRRLINSNFTKNHYFLTLTFNNQDETLDKKSVKDCNKKFTQYIRKLRDRKNNLKYLAVVQFQDTNGRGAVHYHILLNKKPYKRAKREIFNDWKNGSVKIMKMTKVKNVGLYVTAYMQKELSDGRLKGEKSYFTSKNLQQPIIVYGNNNPQQVFKLNEKNLAYRNKYLTKFNETVNFKSYNIF